MKSFGLAVLLISWAVSTAADIDPVAAKQYFEEAQAASNRDGGKMWGMPVAGPILFVDPQTKRCLANEPDAEGKLTADHGLWAGELPKDVPIANYSFKFGGKSYAMVMWPLPKDKSERVALLLHESWHRIQISLSLPPVSPNCGHFGESIARITFRLEMHALAIALQSKGDKAKQAAIDALAYRRLRYADFRHADRDESALERHEGLASYTGGRLAYINDRKLFTHLVAAMRDFEKEPNMGRTFAYQTVPAYGLLLDRYDPTWRTKLSDGKGLVPMLADALHVSWTLPFTVDDAMEKRYGGAKVRAEEEALATARANHVAELRHELIDGPVLDISLSKPKTSFNPSTIVSLGADGDAYGVMTVNDDWGQLEVVNGAALLTNWQRLRVGLPAGFDGSTMSGPGWKLTLNAGWKVVGGTRMGDWVVGKG